MKKFFAISVLVLTPVLMFAGGGHVHPPTPVRGPGGPPGLPVDQYLYVLFAIAILLILFFPKLAKFKR